MKEELEVDDSLLNLAEIIDVLAEVVLGCSSCTMEDMLMDDVLGLTLSLCIQISRVGADVGVGWSNSKDVEGLAEEVCIERFTLIEEVEGKDLRDSR